MELKPGGPIAEHHIQLHPVGWRYCDTCLTYIPPDHFDDHRCERATSRKRGPMDPEVSGPPSKREEHEYDHDAMHFISGLSIGS